MATYRIVTEEKSGKRAAINPEYVVSLSELAPNLVGINLPDGGSVTVEMTLDAAIALLASS